jgi:hypothetical protein
MSVDWNLGGVANMRTLQMVNNGGGALNGFETDALKKLSLLTPEDWSAVSASVGKQCGPDENGDINMLQSSLAWDLADDRATGRLTGALTVQHLKSSMGPGQLPAYNDQLQQAIDFLGRRGQHAPDPDKMIDLYA